MTEIGLKGRRLLHLQLSKNAEGEIMGKFGTIEDFERELTESQWYINVEGEEIRLVSYKHDLTIPCVSQESNWEHPEPYLTAKCVVRKNANDRNGAFATELERPVKVFKAKPKDWGRVEKREPLQAAQQKKPEFVCQNCHKEIFLTELYCTSCGTPINWRCSKCHTPYDVARIDHCPHCGVPRDVVKKTTEETGKDDLEDIEKRRAMKFWDLKWSDDKVTGFITFTGSRDILYELEANNHAEYLRVYDAMVMLWNHRKETGSIRIKRADGWIYLIGEMKRGSKAWIANVFQENKFGKLLDAYEVKLALKEARRQRSPRHPNTH